MKDLADYSSRSVMKALSLMDREAFPGEPKVLELLKTAETERQNYDYNVSVFLQTAQIHNNQESGWFGFTDADAEIYIVSLAIDLTGNGGSPKCVAEGIQPNSSSEANKVGETDQQIFGNLLRTSNIPFVIRSTPLFHNVRDGESLPLLGNGIPIYGPKDPKGLLNLHVSITEDDNAYRKLGELIQQAAKAVKINDIVEKALELASLGSPEAFAIQTAFNLLFYTVTTSLENNKDDIVQDIHLSSLVHQNYHCGILPFDEKGAKGNLLIDVQKTPKE